MEYCEWCGTELRTSFYRGRFHCDHCNKLVSEKGKKEYDNR